MKVALKKVMQNHIYSFGATKKKQKEGGPIGLVLTDPVAKIFMTWWDRQFKRAAEEKGFEIALYRRYVDDITIVARDRTDRAIENEIVVGPDQEKRNDENGMKKLHAIGNGIHPCIQIEAEYPSKCREAKMPILDVKVWLEKQQHSDAYRVLYEFYMKEITTKMVLHARSANPWREKRNILTQEVIRILKNCSLNLPWERKKKHIEDFCLRMQFSGYDKKFRAEVVKSGIQAYNTMRINDEKKITPLHRPRKWRQQEREKEKRAKKENWYKKGGYESVVFIPATPNGELKKRMTEKIKNSRVKLKVVEKNNTTMKKLFQKARLDRVPCADDSCNICKTDEKYMCRQESVTYEIKCQGCGDIYIGETSRTAYTRVSEHMTAYEDKAENSVLMRHCREEHGGEEQTFEIKVRKAFRGDATLRQITESLNIRQEAPRMNGKEEWSGPLRLPQINIDTE